MPRNVCPEKQMDIWVLESLSPSVVDAGGEASPSEERLSEPCNVLAANHEVVVVAGQYDSFISLPYFPNYTRNSFFWVSTVVHRKSLASKDACGFWGAWWRTIASWTTTRLPQASHARRAKYSLSWCVFGGLTWFCVEITVRSLGLQRRVISSAKGGARAPRPPQAQAFTMFRTLIVYLCIYISI